MKKWITICAVLICCVSSYAGLVSDSIRAETRRRVKWYARTYIPIQFAGNIGFLSAGVGFSARRDNYQMSIVYGFSPASISGVDSHLLTAKNIFHFHKFSLSEKRTLIPYGSLGLSLEVGGRSFFLLPSNMPDSYYDFPKSIHLIPSIGVKQRYRTNRVRGFQGIELFAEASTVDAYLWYMFTSQHIRVKQVASIALGIHFLKKVRR